MYLYARLKRFQEKHPELLKENIRKYNVKTWLLNTGLVGGPSGIGSRIKIVHSRAILSAVLEGNLNQVDYCIDPWFGFQIPQSCAGVPTDILNPADSWSDKKAYEKTIQDLVNKFKNNMKRYEESAPQEVLLAGPK